MKTTTFDYSPTRELAYIRLVYFWLVIGVLISAGASWLTLNVGGQAYVTMDKGQPDVLAPAVCAWACDHGWLCFFLSLSLVIAATIFRKMKGVSAVLYLAFTSFMGMFAGPVLFLAQYKASHHMTLSAHPIRDSFFLTLGAFVGLSVYSWTAKRDFSWMRGMLYTGLWVTLIATLLAAVLGSQPFMLAVDSVVILLFCGYIVYDTQRILDKSNGDDAIGDALNLFLDVFNIFIRLVSISSSSSSSRD